MSETSSSARFIPDNSSVIDLGAGAQTLRKHLQGVQISAMRCGSEHAGRLDCDLTRRISDPRAIFDFVICSGILEYIRKPKEFISRVSKFGRTLLLSYNRA